MMDTAPRILRGVPATPYAFGALDGPPDAAPEPAAFEPLFGDPSGDAAFVPLFGEPEAGAEPAEEPEPEPTEADLVRQLTYEQGVQAGLDERAAELAAAQDEISRLRAQAERVESDHARCLQEAVVELADGWERALRDLEPTLATLALETAEAVLDAPLSDTQQAASAQALAAAVDSLASDAAVTVALHPVDLLRIREAGLVETLEGAHPAIHWHPDDALAEGDWHVTTDEGAVHRARREMLAALRDRLGLDAAPDTTP